MNPLLEIPLSREAFAHIERLTATGLYGATPADTAERLLCEKLRDLHTQGQHLDPAETECPWFTVAQIAAQLHRSSGSISRSLSRSGCPPFIAERGPSQRLLRLRYTPRLRAYLTATRAGSQP